MPDFDTTMSILGSAAAGAPLPPPSSSPSAGDESFTKKMSILAQGAAGTLKPPAAPEAPMTAGGVAADVAKGAGVGLAKGAIATATAPHDVPNLISQGIHWGLNKIIPTDENGIMPEGQARLLAGLRDPALKQKGYEQGPDYLAPKVQGAIESVTGPFYEPKTTAGQYAETVGSFVPAMATAGGAGGAFARMRQAAGASIIPGVASETAGQVTKGTEYEPGARLVGAVAGGAVPVVGAPVVEAAQAAASHLPPVTQAGRVAAAERTVGQEIAQAGGGAQAVKSALEQNPDLVPGSQGTLAQRALTPELAQWEDAIRAGNRAAFNNRAAEQNAARVEHLAGMQAQGNPQELVGGLQAQRALTMQQGQAGVEAAQRTAQVQQEATQAWGGAGVAQAQAEHASALDALKNPPASGAPQDTAAYFRSIRDALHSDAEAAVERAQAGSEAAQAGAASRFQNVEEAGRAVRDPAAEALAARKAADSALYEAARIPDSATVPSFGVKARVDEIRKGVTPENRPMAGEEARLFDLAGQYGDQVSFNRLKSLRSSILDEMATTRRENPAAYRRLDMLRGSVEDAMDHAVENQAALDNIAVARGAMAPEDSIGANLATEAERYRSSKRAAVAAGGEGYGGLRGQGQASIPSASGAAGKSVGRSPDVAGSEGLPGRTGAESAVTPDQIAALRKANASYREQREIFGDGPIGDVLEKKPRGADFELSNAEVPRKIFHPGDTGGDAVRGYIKAIGQEKAVPVLNDLAAFMLHEKAFANGVPDTKKISAWLDQHKTALAALPPEVRDKFQTIVSAQRAVDEALSAKRARLNEFDRSAAARVAGLDKPDDIVQTIGGILGQKDGAKIMGDMVTAAKGDEAAMNGIKQAVAEHVLKKFAPDISAPRVSAMRDYIASKGDVLSAAGFSLEEIAALDKRAAAVTETAEKAATAKTASAEAVKSAKAQGEAAVKAAQERAAQRLKPFEETALKNLLNAQSHSDILDVVRGLFTGTNPTAKVASLAQAAKNIPGGAEALKKAVAEVIQREYTGTAQTLSGEAQLKGAPLQKFVRDKADVLRASGLSDEQIGRLSAIVQDQQREAAAFRAAKIAGQSNTTPDAINAAKKRGASILSALASKEIVQAAAGAAGAMEHGVTGGIAGYFGTKFLGALREAGLQETEKLRVAAALDPELALALLEKIPNKPDTAGAARAALRLRRLAISGAIGALPTEKIEARQ